MNDDKSRRFCIQTTQRKLDLFHATLEHQHQDLHTIINHAMYEYIIEHLPDPEHSRIITDLFHKDIQTAQLVTP